MTRSILVIICSFALIVGFFQNCTTAVPFGTRDFFSELVASGTFPYEAGFDQVAYMSCSEQEDIPNQGAFFTFRVGAFDSMGLRIHPNFRNSEEAAELDDDSVIFALQQNVSSAGLRVQLGLRTLDNLQLLFLDQENGNEGIESFDFDNFFPALGDNDLTNILWNLDARDYLRNFAPALFADSSRFEGDLQFMRTQVVENDLRSFMSNRGIITVTFVQEGEINPIGPGSLASLRGDGGGLLSPGVGGSLNSGGAIGSGTSGGVGGSGGSSSGGGGSGTPSIASVSDTDFRTAVNNDVARNVFGMAVQPRFKQPLTAVGGNPGPDMPPRVLSSINEVIIDERKVGEVPRPWQCPASMQFMIVLPEHATFKDDQDNSITRCATNPDPAELTPELKVIRQSLYAEDWFVDMVRKCIVPKSDNVVEGSCYGLNGNTQQTHFINYDTFSSDGCGFGNEKGLCPHYASICIRQ